MATVPQNEVMLTGIEGIDHFNLCDVEVETVRRAAEARNLPFNPDKTSYTRDELSGYGIVREGYNRAELRQLGFGPEAVSCFDERAQSAEELLRVDTPFATGIRKWQLPIDMLPLRVHMTVFPPASKVTLHVHPPNSPEAPGGGLRIVSKGKIFYKGREYGPGDWFFVPNGEPYEFTTDENIETIVFYKYAFFGFVEGNRFSHPHAADH
jgi:hypothetical protein